MSVILENAKAIFDQINCERDKALACLDKQFEPLNSHQVAPVDLKRGSQWLEGQKAWTIRAQAIHRKAEKARARIIIDLLQYNPNYLKESWVSEEVTSWMPRHECMDYLEEAFMQKGARIRPTEKELKRAWRDSGLAHRIDWIVSSQGLSVKAACEMLAHRQDPDEDPDPGFPMWDDDHLLLWKTLEKAYYRHKAKEKLFEKLSRMKPTP